jgi:tRNA threonylcarbamoyl adenosine modification protein YjeE
MRKLILDLSSLENTDAVARKLATNLFPGAILLFWGSMGAGKTTFAKSLCAGLGVLPEIVTSPTYTLVNIYPGDWPVFHVDLYRLNAPEELDDFDREDLITDEGVTNLYSTLVSKPFLNIKGCSVWKVNLVILTYFLRLWNKRIHLYIKL